MTEGIHMLRLISFLAATTALAGSTEEGQFH